MDEPIQQTIKNHPMKHTIPTLLLALALGGFMQQPARAATPSSAFSKGVKVAEAALTLNEVAKLLFDVGSLSGDRARIKVSVELASWSRRVEGANFGFRHMQAFNYRYYPVLMSAMYTWTRLENGKIVTDHEPFIITTLETRNYRCVQDVGPRPTWENRQARFDMAARSTVLEKIGAFAKGLGPWTCTVVSMRTSLPSDCRPIQLTDSQQRKSVSVSTGGRTYFTFDPSGNYHYQVPEILIGSQEATGPVIVVPNPEVGNDAQNDPVPGTGRRASANANANTDQQ